MTLDLSLLPDGGVRWLDASGAHSGRRAVHARCVWRETWTATRSPVGRATANDSAYSCRCARPLSCCQGLTESFLVRIDELGPGERALLFERHLVSKELAGLEPQHPLRSGAAVYLSDGLSVMINEEDHLRMQSLQSGFELRAAYAALDRVDRELGARVPFSYHPEFGFLTACPTNVGTGMRASVLIHLPGLVLTKEIGRVLAGLQQMGLTYRGLYGEGSRGRRQLLPDLEPDDAGPLGRRTCSIS